MRSARASLDRYLELLKCNGLRQIKARNDCAREWAALRLSRQAGRQASKGTSARNWLSELSFTVSLQRAPTKQTFFLINKRSFPNKQLHNSKRRFKFAKSPSSQQQTKPRHL